MPTPRAEPTPPRTSAPSPRRAAALRRSLLAWYRRAHRRLPWRAAPGQRADPYHVLVSEFMLQQTQVATVLPYFQRFLAAFPTLAALAAADEQAVLRLWQGLGYYRRARNLHRAARLIAAQFAGAVPSGVAALCRLPGVGRYTAGAVASIAYGQRAPIVDGNVARVLSRWSANRQPVDAPAGRRFLWALAETLLPPAAPRGSPGDFNQALMELGATVCLPRQPRCPGCPLRRSCQARALGVVAQLPLQKPRRAPKPVTHHILAIDARGRLLLERRPETGLWSALWQLPTLEQAPVGVVAAELRRWVRRRYGLRVGLPRPVRSFTHVTTHRRIAFQVWMTEVSAAVRPVGPAGGRRWLAAAEIAAFPLANPQRQALALMAAAAT